LVRADVIERISALGAKHHLAGDHHGGWPRAEGPLKPAAVLIPIVDRPEGLTILLTRRSDQLVDHPGQVSFPGGRIEPEDPDPEHAALREAFEEIRLEPERVQIIGRLPTYETVTGYEITPVIGLVQPPFELVADPVEVADIFEVPLAFILDPANHERHHRDTSIGRRYFYKLPYQGWNIWGATAGMLVNLAHALQVP
jgi:8-oxo-dGTP pyrophosphatase MutT (NUDIX family)